jgi:hypothetical protein
MNTEVMTTQELLDSNPQLKALWEKDRQIRLNQPIRTSEEFMAQALEMKRVAGLRALSLKKSSSSSGPERTAVLVEQTI